MGQQFRAGAVGGALVVAVIATGCGGGGLKLAAAAPGQVAAGAVSPVTATGGGSICTRVADGINSGISSAAADADAASMRARIIEARSKSTDAVNAAPADLKPDLRVLVDASNKVYDALSQANLI
jgi:hypothetical protein